MSLTSIHFVATSLKSLTRSLLFSLGLDHALIDFLAHTAVGAATVLLAILIRRHPHPAPIADAAVVGLRSGHKATVAVFDGWEPRSLR